MLWLLEPTTCEQDSDDDAMMMTLRMMIIRSSWFHDSHDVDQPNATGVDPLKEHVLRVVSNRDAVILVKWSGNNIFHTSLW